MAKASRLTRQFKYKEIVLDDPNPEWNTKQVIDFYTGTYPELINSNLEGPSVKEDKMVYTINTKTGTKG
jgi:PRTRC genetic system protein C